MNQPFCHLASNQIRFENDQVSPCCWILKKANINNEEDVQNYIHWIKNINDWVPECSYCKNLEDRGLRSGRLQRKLYPNVFNISPDDALGTTTSLEIQINEDCNAACLMCSEQNSSTWKKYNAENDYAFKIKIDQDTKVNTERRLEFIFRTIDFSNIKYLTFLGGEPFKNDSHFKIIKKISEKVDLKDLVVNYVTNGSYFPEDEILQYWSNCKMIKINISVDGIDEHFNYLRWPLQWKQVSKNIEKFYQLDKEKISLTSSYAISPFNIFYHEQYIEWATAKNFKTFFRNPFESVGPINLSCIPISFKYALTKKYENTFPNIVKMIRPFRISDYKHFLKYVKQHDQKRNLNWRKIFPEVSNFFIDI